MSRWDLIEMETGCKPLRVPPPPPKPRPAAVQSNPEAYDYADSLADFFKLPRTDGRYSSLPTGFYVSPEDNVGRSASIEDASLRYIGVFKDRPRQVGHSWRESMGWHGPKIMGGSPEGSTMEHTTAYWRWLYERVCARASL